MKDGYFRIPLAQEPADIVKEQVLVVI